MPCSRRFAAPVGRPAAVFAALFVTLTAVADKPDSKITRPLLYVIEGRNTPVYLFGTIHLPDPRVTNLPPVVYQAVDTTDAFYAELPMDTATMMGGAQKMMLPPDESLRSVLPENVYDKLAKFLEEKGVPLTLFSRFKVWAVTSQLPLLDYMSQMMTNPPMDQALYERARNAGKEVGGLETLDEQIAVFESLSRAEQVRYLDETLDELATEKGKNQIEELVAAYLQGDLKKMLKMADEQFGDKDEMHQRLYNKLIVERNQRMAERIAKKIKENPDQSYVFAVGALHLPGDEGVVTLLKKSGHQVSRIKSTKQLPGQ